MFPNVLTSLMLRGATIFFPRYEEFMFPGNLEIVVLIFSLFTFRLPAFNCGLIVVMSHLLQAHDVDTAINAFTRSVQLDPDNGESWNNLAAL